MSARRGYSQQRVAVNAEGRFISHWDEFVEHRQEVQAKLEEALELSQERREAGLRLTRLCQQLEAKVDFYFNKRYPAREVATSGPLTQDNSSSVTQIYHNENK